MLRIECAARAARQTGRVCEHGPRAGAHGPYAPDRRFSAHAVAERHVHPADAVAMDWLDGSLAELRGLIPNSEFETGDSELRKPAAIGSLCSPSGKSSTVAVQGQVHCWSRSSKQVRDLAVIHAAVAFGVAIKILQNKLSHK
jgi:hypothetical protein